jgi:cytochrome P450
MADTATTATPTKAGAEAFRKNGLPKGATPPKASEIDLSTFDITDPELWRQEAYWDYFARLRKEAPVNYTPESPFGPYWSVSTYKDILTVDTSHGVFSSEGGITVVDQDEDFQLPMFIAMDPPKHDLQRKTVQSIVGPENLKSFETLIRSRTKKLFDELPVGESFDWVDKVSVELTTMMLATLFDFPFEDRRKLTRWSDVATGRNNPEIVTSEEQWRGELLECLGYFTRLWNERVNAEPKGDLVSMLAHGEHTRNMTPQEYLGNLILLIVGGNDTTRNSMTGGVLAMMKKWPDQWDKLKANPALLPSAVSEIIRWQTPLAHMRRTALADFELGGKTIRKGEKVLMWYASGNRDETQYHQPEVVNIERPMVRRHLSFGFGIHRCVGNRLAELQLQILWEEILARYNRIEVLADPERVPSAFVKGYTYMPVKLHAKK